MAKDNCLWYEDCKIDEISCEDCEDYYSDDGEAESREYLDNIRERIAEYIKLVADYSDMVYETA